MHHTYTLQMLCINRISALDLLPRINLSSLAILQQKNQERNIFCACINTDFLRTPLLTDQG